MTWAVPRNARTGKPEWYAINDKMPGYKISICYVNGEERCIVYYGGERIGGPYNRAQAKKAAEKHHAGGRTTRKADAGMAHAVTKKGGRKGQHGLPGALPEGQAGDTGDAGAGGQ